MGDTGKGLDAVGYDFIGRIGYEFSIGLTPQLVVEYATFSVSNANTSAGVLEIMPGVRWAFLAGTYRPWAAFNIGFGHTFPPTLMGVSADSQNGLAYNVGAGLDLYITTSVGFGIHLVYNHVNISTSINNMNVDQSPQWMDLGAGLVITF